MTPLIIGLFAVATGTVASAFLWVPAVKRMAGKPIEGYQARAFGIVDAETLRWVAETFAAVEREWIRNMPDDARRVRHALDKMNVRLVRGTIDARGTPANGWTPNPLTVWSRVDVVERRATLAHEMVHAIKWQLEPNSDGGSDHSLWPKWQSRLPRVVEKDGEI
jgi:hypothetical protein